MEKWRERITEWDRRLEQWEEAYARELARLRKERRRWFRRTSAREEEELAAEARRRAGEELLLEAGAFLDELCAAYLAEPLPQIRAQMRARAGEHDAVLRALWSCADQGPERVRAAGDEEALRLALAAVSLDDLRADLLLVDDVLGRLWIAATAAGIDPRPHFEAVAQLSNPGTGGGGAFMRPHLSGFERSLHFKRSVRPRLKELAV